MHCTASLCLKSHAVTKFITELSALSFDGRCINDVILGGASSKKVNYVTLAFLSRVNNETNSMLFDTRNLSNVSENNLSIYPFYDNFKML